MTPSTTTTAIDLAAWETGALQRAAKQDEPAWVIDQRRVAAGHARALGLPSRDHELWRRIDFRTLEQALPSLDPFRETAATRDLGDLPAALLERLGGESGRVGLVVQRDSGVVIAQTASELARQGVIVCPLGRALVEHGNLLRERLGALIEPDYDGYAALGAALRSGGAFVYVPDGVEAAVPIRLFDWLDGVGALAAPRTVIVLGKNARATIVHEQLSESAEGIAFHLGGTEVFLGQDAKLVYGTLQEWGRHVYHYSNQRVQVGRGAELQWIQTILGGRMVKTNSYFNMIGPGAQVFVHGFMFGDGRQQFHLHTLQRHLADHCTSDLLIKGCLKDRARSIYQGLIQVAEGAQRTDAYQANRNLLLSDTARADSIPGLEILANDVRCTHGATIGSVDPEQMYYLMSRGLPRNTAQRLIVEGFFAPVIDRIPLEGIREHLRQVIQRKIG
ncbi:MAG: Fe-S cluster assembly protein SufD [Candidatus Eisenbacteria bacterium]